MNETVDLAADEAETATEVVRVTPSVKAELERRQREFYALHRVKPSVSSMIAAALADRKPVQP